MRWQSVMDGVWMFADSCNVYALRGPGGMVLVNAGTGRWLDHLAELPAAPAALALTHHFRDHSAGAAEAARRGIPVYAAQFLRAILEAPEDYLPRHPSAIGDEIYWARNFPIEPIKIAGVLRDYETATLAGVPLEVLPLPGMTMGQIGLGLRRDGGLIVFCGEAIHSPGRLARVAPLQYNFNDFPGGVQAYFTAKYLRKLKPAALLPSLGEPMLENTDGALAKLQDNLRAACAGRLGLAAALEMADKPDLTKVTDHVYLSTDSWANATFIISDSGKALVLDYGYRRTDLHVPGPLEPQNRRAILHGLDGLKERFGIDRVDVVIPTHAHDDHIAGIPTLQRLFGTRCWAPETFADELENAEASHIPLGWSEPIRVDRRIGIDEKVKWEEYTFHFGAMSGHTRYAALIGFTADGKRFAHTGDQYCIPSSGVDPVHGMEIVQNHAPTHGALIDGYAQSERWMMAWRPEVVLIGHRVPTFTNDEYFRRLHRHTEIYEEVHRSLMPLGDQDAHFNADSWGAWVWPYRAHARGLTATVRVTARNPLPRRAKLEVKLVGPAGWKGGGAVLDAAARADVSCELEITAPAPGRRVRYAVDLCADGRPFGQVGDGVVTVGFEKF